MFDLNGDQAAHDPSEFHRQHAGPGAYFEHRGIERQFGSCDDTPED